NWRSIQKNAKGAKVKKLDQLAEALKAFLKDAPNHWVFEESEERMMPCLVTGITYIPRNRKKEIEAHVRLDTIHMERGHEKDDNFTWHVDSLRGGVTAEEALAKENLYFPSTEMLTRYDTSMQRYKQ